MKKQQTKGISIHQLDPYKMHGLVQPTIEENIMTIADSENMYRYEMGKQRQLTCLQKTNIAKHHQLAKCQSVEVARKQYLVGLGGKVLWVMSDSGWVDVVEGAVDFVTDNIGEDVDVWVLARTTHNYDLLKFTISDDMVSKPHLQHTSILPCSLDPTLPLQILSSSILLHNKRTILHDRKPIQVHIPTVHKDNPILRILYLDTHKLHYTNKLLLIFLTKNQECLVYEGEDSWQEIMVRDICACGTLMMKDLSVLYFITHQSSSTRLLLFTRLHADELYVKFGEYNLGIMSPIPIRQLRQSKTHLYILDENSLAVHCINGSLLLEESSKYEEEQGSIHDNVKNTLIYRHKNLRMVKKYMDDSDYSSALRCLAACDNISVLNDGMVLMYRYVQMGGEWLQVGKYVLMLMDLCTRGLESKYQTHIENALTLLTAVHKGMVTIPIQIQKKQRQIVGGKRLRKLTQQSKKKNLFELAYQYINLVNSARLLS